LINFKKIVGHIYCVINYFNHASFVIAHIFFLFILQLADVGELLEAVFNSG